MKSVLRSIKPYWFYLICEGRKTIEVGKNTPTSEDWDKITYLYCSKDIKSFNRIPKEHREKYRKYLGKVGAKFVCDEIICCQAFYGASGLKHLTNIFGDELQQTSLTKYELFDYIVGKEKFGTGWLWHISELKIYDEPRNLTFYKPCPMQWKNCSVCEFYSSYTGSCLNRVKHAPRSWCYVED